MYRIKNIYKDLFENPMGRISRSDFWLIFLFQFIVWIFLVTSFPEGSLIIFPALWLVVTGPIFQIKRYHDSGHKAWWVLMPIANIIFLFYSTTEDNKWGPKDKT